MITDCFMKISISDWFLDRTLSKEKQWIKLIYGTQPKTYQFHGMEMVEISSKICSDDWREIFMKQSVNKYR